MAAKLQGPALFLSKVSILAVWAWGVACFFLDPTTDGWVSSGRWIVVALLAIHALELFIHGPKLKKAKESVSSHIVPLMIFGGIHFLSLDLSDRD